MSEKPTALILEDLEERSGSLISALKEVGFDVMGCERTALAFKRLRREYPGAVLFLDHDLDQLGRLAAIHVGTGTHVVQDIIAHAPRHPLIVVHSSNRIAGPAMTIDLRENGHRAIWAPLPLQGGARMFTEVAQIALGAVQALTALGSNHA